MSRPSTPHELNLFWDSTCPTCEHELEETEFIDDDGTYASICVNCGSVYSLSNPIEDAPEEEPYDNALDILRLALG